MFDRRPGDQDRPRDLPPEEVLRAAVEGYHAENLAWVDDDDLMGSVESMVQLTERLRAQTLRRVAEIDRRNAYRPTGHVSMTGWLKDRCGMASGEAREHTRVARGMDRMVETAKAFRAGEIDWVRVRALTHAYRRHPLEYIRHEKVLVNNAKSLSVGDHRKALAYWSQALDHDEALEDAEALYEKRRWHQSRGFSGMELIDAELDPETGHLIATAVSALADPGNLDPDDTRTPTQRRADAVGDVFRFFLDHRQGLPTTHGERPHGSVIVDYRTLLDNQPGRAETLDGRVLHPETIRRMLCDATITRILTGPDESPLNVGRARRTVTPAQWKALVLRDGGCVHPGCGRPPAWCDVHHKVPWAEGGTTDLANLELRCRLHHRLVHEGQATRPQWRRRHPKIDQPPTPHPEEPPRARGP